MNKRRFQFIVVFMTAFPILTIAVLAALGMFEVRELKNFGAVAPFELEDRNIQKISKDSLLGRVWVANFIFTHCPTQCPLIVQEVKKVQKALRLKENFRIVSITVDPARDTAPVLSKYADAIGADPFKWYFLTGQKNDIQSLIQNGFRLSAADEGGVMGSDIVHSNKLVLVDHLGYIRGYYDANEPREIKNIIKDAKALLKKTFNVPHNTQKVAAK